MAIALVVVIVIAVSAGYIIIIQPGTTTTSPLTSFTSSATPEPESIQVEPQPVGSTPMLVSESENRSNFLKLDNVTFRSDIDNAMIWHQCGNYTLKFEFETQPGNYSKLIGKNVTLGLTIRGQHLSAHLRNVTIEMKASQKITYEAEVDTCTDELGKVNVKRCIELTAEVKADVEVQFNSTVIFEHPDWTLVSKTAELCDPVSGLLYLTAQQLCLRPDGPLCPLPPHIHLHSDAADAIPDNPIPWPDDPMTVPGWNPTDSTTTMTISNYGTTPIVVNAVYAISTGSDGFVKSQKIPRHDSLAYRANISLTVMYASEPALGILIFYSYP